MLYEKRYKPNKGVDKIMKSINTMYNQEIQNNISHTFNCMERFKYYYMYNFNNKKQIKNKELIEKNV
jgi:hypothetical protein